MDHTTLINHFYQCFQAKDYVGMQACYHEDACFSDPAFGDLHAAEVKAMWEMLLKRAPDLAVSFCDMRVDGDIGYIQWRAAYTFSATGRKVINNVTATFTFKDNLILTHNDKFNFYAWAKQSLGMKGFLLGNTGFLKKKVQQQARKSLEAFMLKKNK